jgi:hypothetical protein
MADEQVVLGGWVGGAILVGFSFLLLAIDKRGGIVTNTRIYQASEGTLDPNV